MKLVAVSVELLAVCLVVQLELWMVVTMVAWKAASSVVLLESQMVGWLVALLAHPWVGKMVEKKGTKKVDMSVAQSE
jgi:hypothetical protein